MIQKRFSINIIYLKIQILLIGIVSAGRNTFLRPSDCTPGTKWFNGCGYCYCQEDEYDACEESHCAVECEPNNPGSAFFDGYRWCFCHTDPDKTLCIDLDI